MAAGGKLILLFIGIVFLDVAISHEPGRGHRGGQHQQRGRGGGGSGHQGHGYPGSPLGGNPGGRHQSAGPHEHPHGQSSGGHHSDPINLNSDPGNEGNNVRKAEQGPVIPRCLLEKTSAFIIRKVFAASRNVTSFTPRCKLDYSFRCHQEWLEVGLSWQADSEGRMVDKTLTKGIPRCPQNTEKTREEEEPAFMQWFKRNAAICLNDDGGDTVNTGDGGDDIITDGSGVGSGDIDDNDNIDADNVNNDDDDDDDNNEDGFSDENDDYVSIEISDADVASFRNMGFLGECGRLGKNPRQHHNHRHQHHHQQNHCPRINWIQQPDLYEEFGFKPPAVCPRNQPMQSNCSPSLCNLVTCGKDRNVICRINPCGTCRPECYDTKGDPKRPPRALTKCEYKRRLGMKYRSLFGMNLIPKCNEDGSFAETQCFPYAKVCWCVDEDGRERNGTRQTGKPISCKSTDPVLSPCQSMQLNIRNLKERLSKMVTSCNETGNDLQSQVNNATQWIQQRPRVTPQNQRELKRNCTKPKMFCARFFRMIARREKWLAKYLAEPKCAAGGNFEKMQCNPAEKKCWCVDEDGTRIGFKKNRGNLRCPNTDEGRRNNCPPVIAVHESQSQASPCRNDNDCSGSKVCCKTHRGGKKCVDPPPKMPAVKPGNCPALPLSVNFTCRSKCKSDADCRGDMKCCRLGCGNNCIAANMPVCPKDKPFKLCIYDKCLSSPGCPNHPLARCRMNYCGECSAEYLDENNRKINCNNATKCQKQRHAAIEEYKEKFLRTFNTMPVRLPAARDNQLTRLQQAGAHWNSEGRNPNSEPGSSQRGGQDGWHRSREERDQRQGGILNTAQRASHGNRSDGTQGQGREERRDINSGQRQRSGQGQGGQLGRNGRQRRGHHAGDGGRRGGDLGRMQQGAQGGQSWMQSRRIGASITGNRRGGNGQGRANASGIQQLGQGRWRNDQGRRPSGRTGGRQGERSGGQRRGMGVRGRGGLAAGGGHWGGGQWQHGDVGRNNQVSSQQADLGVFIPECNPENGAFMAEQCNATSDVCWCVDSNGQEKQNTRELVGRGTRDCSKVGNKPYVDGGDLEKERQGKRGKRVASLTFSLNGNFDDVEGREEEFTNLLKKNVASIGGLKEEQIQFAKIWAGSIKAKFEIVEDVQSGSFEEILPLIKAKVTSRKFAITFDENEYYSDGTFNVSLKYRPDNKNTEHSNRLSQYRPDNKNTEHSRRLSLAEVIAIGSCTTVAILGSAVLAYKCRICQCRSKKGEPEGWKDMGKENCPQVQYVMPEPSKPPNGGKGKPKA